ncbi:MAG: hypothetical protein GY723_03550 [bacterium]|nr:hypothetical protein [bacterium]
MLASYLPDTDLEVLLDPDASAWRAGASETLPLTGTPLGMQPTAAIRASWIDRRIGAVDEVRVAALHNGQGLAFRLEWEDASENNDLDDNTSFPDAAAIALPANEDSPIIVMGKPGAAVNAWHWRADAPSQAREISAEGLGTTAPVPGSGIRAHGVWKDGRWRVVIGRELESAGGPMAAQLRPGTQTGFGVAIWEGSNQERAGIKAFSGDWQILSIEATGGAGGGRK